MPKYHVALEVVYGVVVEADSEEEAIQIAIDDCPFDNDGEPAVDLIEEDDDEIEYNNF